MSVHFHQKCSTSQYVLSDTVNWNAISCTEIENLVDCEKLKGLRMLVRDPVIPMKNMVVTKSGFVAAYC